MTDAPGSEEQWLRCQADLAFYFDATDEGMVFIITRGRWVDSGETFLATLRRAMPPGREVRIIDLAREPIERLVSEPGDIVWLALGLTEMSREDRGGVLTTLNRHRGLLNHHQVRLVLWLDPSLADEINTHAADLLSWRTRLLDVPVGMPLGIDFGRVLDVGLRGARSLDRDAMLAALPDLGSQVLRLVTRSLTAGLADLIEDHLHFLDLTEPRASAFVVDVAPNADILIKPEALTALHALRVHLADWLRDHGRRGDPQGLYEHPVRARSIADRLGPYYAAALAREYRANAADYTAIWDAVQSPVTGIEEWAQDWRRYRAWLMRQPHAPLFADSFSLHQVYQRLRAWQWEPDPEADADEEPDLLDAPRHAVHRRRRPRRKVVIDAMDAINGWLTDGERADALRVISGGPGAGKSSLAKMIAANRADLGERVLLIELHHFQLADDLETAINRFGRSRGLRHDVLDHPDAGPLLLIFDGLDELSIRGSAGKGAVLELVEGVTSLLRSRNHDTPRLRALLLGREVVVQGLGARFKRAGQLLTLLPYRVSQDERRKYHDPDGRLATDQRHDWWAAYGALTGRGYDALPEVLNRGRVAELTAEPLLNYLVAITLDQRRVDFADPDTALTEIYADLVQQVFERVHACGPGEDARALPGLESVEARHFHDFLQAIAVVAWHGEGRTARLSAIEARVGESLLKKMDLLRKGSEAAISRLIAAFYFRQHADSDVGDPTYEFTHQSFAEYLIAREILAFLDVLHEEAEAHARNSRRGWPPDRQLTEWARLFGPSAIEPHVFDFVHDGLRRLARDDKERVQAYQTRIGDLISRVLATDFPTDALPHGPYLSTALAHSRNAGEALLVVASACARVTDAVTPVNHPTPVAMGTWLRRLQGQRADPDNVMAMRHLSRLDLSETRLGSIDLFGADLLRADLLRADLRGADLRGADLRGAGLRGAHLQEANLQEANLQEANLQEANLQEANLQEANLQDAWLEEAYLLGAHLQEANLLRADLRGADLRGADLLRADLRGAHLLEARYDNSTQWPPGFDARQHGAGPAEKS